MATAASQQGGQCNCCVCHLLQCLIGRMMSVLAQARLFFFFWPPQSNLREAAKRMPRGKHLILQPRKRWYQIIQAGQTKQQFAGLRWMPLAAFHTDIPPPTHSSYFKMSNILHRGHLEPSGLRWGMEYRGAHINVLELSGVSCHT